MTDDVQEGLAGWLFLKGGSNRAADFYTEKSAFPAEHLEAWIELLKTRDRQCRTLGTRYFHLLAPDKTSVYPELYGTELPFFDDHPIRSFNRRLAGQDFWINVLDNLLSTKSDSELYYKTDTHWNFSGCYSAYCSICTALGVQINSALPDRPSATAELAMDLGSKLNPPVKELCRFYHIIRDAKRIFANGIVKFNESEQARLLGTVHYNSAVAYSNSNAGAVNKRILIFGDSFSEFRPHMLTAMLAETFKEVFFVWNHSIDFALVKEYKPDILLTETVERFVNRVPVDNLNLKLEEERKLSEIARQISAAK